jgi:hypothetical protein
MFGSSWTFATRARTFEVCVSRTCWHASALCSFALCSFTQSRFEMASFPQETFSRQNQVDLKKNPAWPVRPRSDLMEGCEKACPQPTSNLEVCFPSSPFRSFCAWGPQNTRMCKLFRLLRQARSAHVEEHIQDLKRDLPSCKKGWTCKVVINHLRILHQEELHLQSRRQDILACMVARCGE